MTLAMTKYISDAAERFGIDTTRKIDNPLSTGCIGKDSTTPATPQQQKIIGVLLYYARAIDSTVLTRISKLSTQRATLMAAERTLQYLATQPEASVVFHRSDMRLICYSDAFNELVLDTIKTLVEIVSVVAAAYLYSSCNILLCSPWDHFIDTIQQFNLKTFLRGIHLLIRKDSFPTKQYHNLKRSDVIIFPIQILFVRHDMSS
jgi:hypothetical protein